MSAPLLAGCVLAVLVLAVAGGMFARSRLPTHHLNTESKEVIRLATAVVGTLAALALGLLIASAKSDYDDAQTDLKETAARIVLLDRVLAQYGKDTDEARTLLRHLIERRLDTGWNIQARDRDAPGIEPEYKEIEAVQMQIRVLVPANGPHGMLQARALEIAGELAEGHWLQVETPDEGLPSGFLVVLIYWLALLFATFGLQAPSNPTVLAIIIVCAMCVAGAVFAISDMANPYAGLIRISDEPLRAALARVGRA